LCSGALLPAFTEGFTIAFRQCIGHSFIMNLRSFFAHRGNPHETTAISGKKMSYESNIDDAAVDKAVKQVQAGKTAPFEVVVRWYERPLRACASAPRMRVSPEAGPKAAIRGKTLTIGGRFDILTTSCRQVRLGPGPRKSVLSLKTCAVRCGGSKSERVISCRISAWRVK
jgi:hypothetical protein